MGEPLGSGRRSRQLQAQLAAKGARNPAGLAAWMGRKKYGNERFNRLAQEGRARAEREREGTPAEAAPPKRRHYV